MGLTSLNEWMAFLSGIFPPSGACLVGAPRDGALSKYIELPLDRLVVIEADEELCGELALDWKGSAKVSVHCGVMSDSNATQKFYLASNPAESSLLEIAPLGKIWRNLALAEVGQRFGTTLDDFLSNFEARWSWVMVDCLPALKVLRGSSTTLRDADVIVARGVIAPGVLQGCEASCGELDDYLTPKNFLRIATLPERNGLVASLVYVRDWRSQYAESTTEQTAQLSALTQSRDEQSQLAAERANQIVALTKTREEQTAQLSALTQSRDEQSQLAAERANQIAALTKTREEQTAQLSALMQSRDEQSQLASERANQIAALTKTREEQTAQLSALTKSRDEQSQLAAERANQIVALTKTREEQTAQLSALTKSRDEQARLASESQTKAEQIGKEKQQLAVEKETLQKDKMALTAARDEQTKKADAAAKQAAKLEAELAELSARHNLLKEDLLRAEAQIEFIADLLLRENAP